MSSSAWVVTSPMTTQRPLVIAVSQATRAAGSCPSIPSRTASETWSQILSGCPSVTDSDVRRNDREELKVVVTKPDDTRGRSSNSSPLVGKYAAKPRDGANSSPLVGKYAAKPRDGANSSPLVGKYAAKPRDGANS